MKTPFTLSEKIIASILFVIGVFLSYQAIEGYIYIIYYISPDSYRILVSTYVSNLVNGNLLILSSLLFFKKKILGALAFQFTGIMLILYAINFSLYDLIVYDTYDVFVDTVIIMTLLTLGLLIYFYFIFISICFLLMGVCLQNKKSNRIFDCFFLLVVSPGFEPRQAEPKTAVLPLHHETNSCFF